MEELISKILHHLEEVIDTHGKLMEGFKKEHEKQVITSLQLDHKRIIDETAIAKKHQLDTIQRMREKYCTRTSTPKKHYD
jgi:hypothetical protein